MEWKEISKEKPLNNGYYLFCHPNHLPYIAFYIYHEISPSITINGEQTFPKYWTEILESPKF